ncbi:hypothetical protein [Rhodospirillum sp. A1_3_36]|uniref:hypothetical protein n=1 Tax=Rhodospirillum sp. A1_3_36 TaxID=3391666 RepID=UPI0039A4C879
MTISFSRMPMPTDFEDLDAGDLHQESSPWDKPEALSTRHQPEVLHGSTVEFLDLGHIDDHLRILDILFAEAEALTHGNHGKVMTPVDRKRLMTLTREIDGLLDRAEGLPGPATAPDADDNLELRMALDRREELETRVPGKEDAYERLDTFEEPTVDEVLIAFGSRAVAARVQSTDALTLGRQNGHLTLDVENALDRITAQLDLSMAMDLTSVEIFSPTWVSPLAPPDAARMDAVLTCMDRILATCPEHFLTPDAQGELEALMAEADRILGISEKKSIPKPSSRRNGEAWRRAMNALGRQVTALIPGARILPT